jgi:hypothetical protein
LSKPEEDPAVGTESLEVGMARRAVLAGVVVLVEDAQRGQRSGVEGDGAVHVADRQKDMVEHEGLSNQML